MDKQHAICNGLTSPRVRQLACLFSLVLLLSGATLGDAGGQERVEIIIVEGESPLLENDTIQAKQRALQDAFAAAVQKVIGTFVSAESFSQNFVSIDRSILTKARGYIKSYEILTEQQTPDTLTLTTRVTVSVDPIRDELTALGILLEAMGNPRVLILVAEAGARGDLTLASAAARELQRVLTEKGFNVLDASRLEVEPGKAAIEQMGDRSAAELVRLGKQASADVLIFGKGVIQQLTTQGLAGLAGGVVQLEATAIWVETGKAIVTRTARMNGVGPTATSALDQAYGKAGQEMASQLMGEIVEKWSAAALNGRELVLQLEVEDYAKLHRFRKRLGRIFGVRKATQKAFSGTAATIELTFTGSAEMLADLIATTEFPDLRVRITEFTADQLKLQIQ